MPEFVLEEPLDLFAEGDDMEEDELEFYVSGPPTGWTDQDTDILEKALDMAGITGAAERLEASLAVDMLGIVILAPLVDLVESEQAQIRSYFGRIKGGIGK